MGQKSGLNQNLGQKWVLQKLKIQRNMKIKTRVIDDLRHILKNTKKGFIDPIAPFKIK